MSYSVKPFIGRNSYTVYVPLLNFTANQINLFTDTASRNLLNPANSENHVVIRAVETFYSSLLAFDNQQRPIVSQANAANLVVTLRVGKDVPIYQIPYLDFATQLNYGIVKELFPSEINLSKSDVTCLGALPDGTTSAAFVFWYETLTPAEYHEYTRNMRKRILQEL